MTDDDFCLEMSVTVTKKKTVFLRTTPSSGWSDHMISCTFVKSNEDHIDYKG